MLWVLNLKTKPSPPLIRNFIMATLKESPTMSEEAVPHIPEITSVSDNTNIQTTGFTDEKNDSPVTFSRITDSTFHHDGSDSADLGDFLSRPVEIFSISWDQTLQINHTFLPWFLFFDNPAIKKKIDNYAFLQCNLHVKAVVNASPFFYGKALVCYNPMDQFADRSARTAPVYSSPGTPHQKILISQRPHFVIKPASNMGGEMVLPFFHHKNWLNVTNSGELADMGRLFFFDILGLHNANGVTTDVVNVTFYAWATDVKLRGPTLELSMQSGKLKKMETKDEYGKGPVSSVASAVAGAADQLIKVPIIGVYAKATSIGASAVSKIASLFGFTNVPVINNQMPMKNIPLHAMSTGTIGKPFDKMTIDAKNELSIDPRTVGLGESDELSISSLVTRESLLARAVWSTSDAKEVVLFSSLVTPCLYGVTTVNNGVAHFHTPMSQVSRNFTYWRGEIVFRLEIVATQYHRGRLKFCWDPLSDITVSNGTTTTNFTRILDMDYEGSYEIRIPFIQRRHWLSTFTASRSSTEHWFVKGTAPPYGAPSSAFCNGTVTLSVLNELTSPVATSNVYVLVHVRGCENLEFAYPRAPCSATDQSSYFEPQSGIMRSLNCEAIDNSDVSRPENQSLVYHGEEYHSMRPILRRMVFETTLTLYSSVSLTDTIQHLQFVRSKFPAYYGWDPTSPTGAFNSAPSSAPFNYDKVTPFSLIVPCFVGMRGSINRSYVLNAFGKEEFISTFAAGESSAEIPRTAGRLNYVSEIGTSSTPDNNHTSYQSQIGMSSFATGSSITHTAVMPVLEVCHPHFYPTRFVSTRPDHQVLGNSEDDSRYHGTFLQLSIKPALDTAVRNATVHKFYGIGTDFNVFFFLNVPVQYFYTATPGP